MKNKSTGSLDEKRRTATKLMQEEGLDALLLEAPADLFFWTGLPLSMGSFLITKRSMKLFVDGRYSQLCHERAGIPTHPHTKLALPNGQIGFDATSTSYARFLTLKKKAPGKLKGYDGLGQKLRAVKTPQEIALIKKAGALATEAVGFIEQRLKPGVSEKQIATAVDGFFKDHDATTSFSPIIAFGPNSAMPHSRPTDRKLNKNDIALIDIGCNLGGYCSDMTRFFFVGKKEPKHLAIYQAVKEALDAALSLVREGILPDELERAAREAITRAGFDPYPHSLGHGVGIEVHELPKIAQRVKEPLKSQMVVTIEPGVYIEGVGGVRLENQILIEERGYTNLTPYPFE